MSITITRGLVELKTLNDRITKAINEFTPLTISTGGKLPAGIETKDEFSKLAKSQLQKINDLLKRKDLIRSKITESNAVNKVTISGETMTVTAAISRKESMASRKLLHTRCVSLFASNSQSIAQAEVHLVKRIDELLKEVKPENQEKYIEILRSENEPKLIDPCGIKSLIEKTSESITAFEQEVDVVLSESNAKTEIDV